MSAIDVKYFEQFTAVTGIKVKTVENDTQLDPNHELSDKELSRNISCRFDKEADTIYLRVKENSLLSEEYIKKQCATKVISSVIYIRGLENFFKEGEQKRFSDSLEGMLRSTEKGAYLSDKAENLRYQLNFYLSTNPAAVWMVKSYLEDATGIQLSEKYETVIRDAQMNHSKVKLADAYKCAGYPDGFLSVKTEDIAAYLEKNGMSFSMLPEDFISRLNNPLAIIFSGRKNKNGENKCLAITSIRTKGGDYVTISLPSPEKIISDRVANPTHSFVGGYPISLSEASVFQSLQYSQQNRAEYNKNRLDANNILFLQESDSKIGHKYTLLDYIEDNIQKIGAELSPGHSGSDVQSLKIVVANIRNNFENTNISRKIYDTFAIKQREREKISRMLKETEGMAPLQNTAPANKNKEQEEADNKASIIRKFLAPPVPPIAERRKTDIISLAKDGGLRETTIKKLEKNGLYTVASLSKLGADCVKDLIGEREFNKLEKLINEKVNWTIRKREATLSEEEFSCPEIDKDGVIRKNTEQCALRCPGTKDFETMNLDYPLRKDGRPFENFAGVSLLFKSAALSVRWDGCPYFYTREELNSIGFEPTRFAEPSHICDSDGKYITVYNLRETTLYTNRPDIYSKLILASAAKNVQIPYELRSVMESFRPRFDGRKTLIAEHYFSETYNDILSTADIIKGCSFISVVGNEEYGKIVADAEAKRLEKDRTMIALAETRQSKEIALSRSATPEEWFSNLPLINKLYVLGYPDIHMAGKELLESGYFVASKGEKVDLEKALQKKFLSLSANEKQNAIERFEAYQDMATRLKEGQYDITDLFPVKINEQGNVLLKIDENKTPIISIKVGIVFRPVRPDAISAKQIYDMADNLYKKIRTSSRAALNEKAKLHLEKSLNPSSGPVTEKTKTPGRN